MDEAWLRVLAGEDRVPGAPVLPDEGMQVMTVGRAGRRIMVDAFLFQGFLKSLLATHAKPLSRETRVLDFGCGWGRILRVFLNEVDPGNLLGLDVQPSMVDLAIETTGHDHYRTCEVLPPTGLPSGSFDLVYSYSVFSHLAPSTAFAWIAELSRLLAPGGILCVTTRPRAHIEIWHKERHEKSVHSQHYAHLFADAGSDLARFDRGEFVFHPGAQRYLRARHYGEAVVPEAYARTFWTLPGMAFLGYFEKYAASYLQPAIVLQRIG